MEVSGHCIQQLRSNDKAERREEVAEVSALAFKIAAGGGAARLRASVQPILHAQAGDFLEIHEVAREQQRVVREADGSVACPRTLSHSL